jgi:hypothetical protein
MLVVRLRSKESWLSGLISDIGISAISQGVLGETNGSERRFRTMRSYFLEQLRCRAQSACSFVCAFWDHPQSQSVFVAAGGMQQVLPLERFS